MVFFKFILLVLAFFITLLWITKLVTDCVSAIYGSNFSEENAQKDGILRLYMIAAMAILWPLIIIL
jgi:hypothetical protein